MPSPYGRQRPRTTSASSADAGTRPTRRDLPTPGRPRIVNSWQRPLGPPGSQASRSNAQLASRGRPSARRAAREPVLAATESRRWAATGSAFPLSESGSSALDLDGVAGQPHACLLADQDLARLRRLLEPRGDVDRVTGREPLLGAGHDLAGRHADASLDAELGERVAHLDRRAHRPQRVVLVHDRDAEDGHHRVADELLDRAAVALDDRPHPLEVAGEQRPQRLRVERSPSAVEPVTSQKSTVTVLRCSRAGAAVSAAPQKGQNRNSPGSSLPAGRAGRHVIESKRPLS